MNVRIARRGGEVAHDRQQVRNRDVGMHEGVFRVQRGQLYRDARRGAHITGGFAHQPRDGFVIIDAIAFGIVEGHCCFAEHVEAVRQAPRAFGGCPLERFVDRAAVNELSAQNAHGLQRGTADDRLAQPVHRALEGLAHALLRFFGPLEHFAGQHQRESRRIDEGRGTLAHVLGPVDVADLVADKRIGSRRIGYAKQRLGKAHQRHTLLGSEAVLVQEGVDPARLALASFLDQVDRDRLGFFMFGACPTGLCHAFGDAGVLFRAIGFAEGLAGDGGQAGRIVQGHTTPNRKRDEAGPLDLRCIPFKLCGTRLFRSVCSLLRREPFGHCLLRVLWQVQAQLAAPPQHVMRAARIFVVDEVTQLGSVERPAEMFAQIRQ